MNNKKIKVAIIDTGVDLNNEYIGNSIQSGYGILWNNNKMIYTNNYFDDNGHGTACASIMLNQCKNIEFIVIKAMNKDARTSLLVIEEALKSLIETDVSIINMSFCINQDVDSNLYCICKQLVKENKVLVASLANNYGVSYPAFFNNVIGVRGAVLESAETIYFNHNKRIQCIADDNPSMSAYLDNKYQMRNRCNSLATARVTGIICKLISANKELTIDNINFNVICKLLNDYALHNEWSKEDLLIRKRCPSEKEWYIDNENPLLLKIYDIVKEKIELFENSKYICDYELITRRGNLSLDLAYEFMKDISNKLSINIDYMEISRFDLITLGTLTNYLKRYLL